MGPATKLEEAYQGMPVQSDLVSSVITRSVNFRRRYCGLRSRVTSCPAIGVILVRGVVAHLGAIAKDVSLFLRDVTQGKSGGCGANM